MKIVQITGQRNWDDWNAIRQALTEEKPDLVIHGACRGADLMAAHVAKSMGIATLAFPAEWDKYGKAAGPIRNRHMAAVSVDLEERGDNVIVLAFLDEERYQGSRGTRSMISFCEQADLHIRIVTTCPF